MFRRLPDIADGVPIYDLLCRGDEDAPPILLERPVAADDGDVAHVTAVTAAIVRAATHRTGRRLRALYDLVRSDTPEVYAQALLDALGQSGAPPTQLRILGRWLATHGAHHGPVALGILILGVAGFGDDDGVVRCLGSYAAFAEVAALAARQGAADPDGFVWHLARSTTGSGRSTCVRLLAGTGRPDIRRWVLGEEWAGPGDASGALLAAEVGGLGTALAADRVDPEVMDAAARIFRTLTAAQSDPDLAALVQAPEAVDAFVRHVSRRQVRIADFLAVEAIRRFLVERGERVAGVWGATRRAEAIGRCAAVLGDDVWDAVLIDALGSASSDDFTALAGAAEARGIDTFPYRLARLEADPSGASWRMAFDQADQMRARRLAAVAARSLRPGSEASPQRAPVWDALDSLLECLGRHPGIGGDVVMVGLSAGAAVHRLAALRTLETWGRDHWPEGAFRAVRACATGDPDPGVRGLAARLSD